MPDEIIRLRVTNTSISIEGKLDKEVYTKLKKVLGYKPENAFFMLQRQPKRKWAWDGLITTVCYNRHHCKCPVKKDGTHFPTGLYSKAKTLLENHGITCITVDDRKTAEKSLVASTSDELEHREYQTDVINKACERQRGIIKAATGSGKTAIGAGIIAELGVAPFIFYVPSIDLLLQTRQELERFLRINGKSVEVGIIGGGFCDIKDINVMTVQTAVRAVGEKYVKFDEEDSGAKQQLEDNQYSAISDLIGSAKGIIGDEVQHWAAETCQIISDYSESCFYKYGFSATPWRDKGDDILIDACFGKIIADISASFLIKEGFLVRPDIYFVPVKHPTYNLASYAKLYEAAIVNNPVRNGYVAQIAERFASQGKVVLILCRYVSHGETLKEMIDNSVFLSGANKGKEREKHLQKMRDRQASVTIATSIFDEGIDCRPLDTLILAGSGKSQTRALQRIGRTLRPFENKTHANIIDFHDKCKYMLSHSRKRRKIYETEPEFNIEQLEV